MRCARVCQNTNKIHIGNIIIYSKKQTLLRDRDKGEDVGSSICQSLVLQGRQAREIKGIQAESIYR